MEFIKLLEISTGHISFNDAKLLNKLSKKDEDIYLITVSSNGYGYYVSFTADMIEEKEEVENLLKAGFSREFINILLKAHENECYKILFDRDVQISTELSTFFW